MGKIAVLKYFTLMITVFQVVITIFTFIGLFGGDAHPSGNTASAMLVYILPLLIVANAVLLVFWLIRRSWIISILPTVTILSCIPYIGTIYQPRGFQAPHNNGKEIKVATYNVARFGNETSGFISLDILAELKKQNVDIFCAQEYSQHSGDKDNTQTYKEYFPYAAKGNDDMMIFSRFPIVKSGNIPFEGSGNSAMWATVSINGKRTTVYNLHLETTGFNSTMHHVSKVENDGTVVESNVILQAIYSNYTLGMVNRSYQVDIVAEEMKKTRGQMIVCGDFNDVPYSYTYNTILGDLVDGFKECGNGWMFTFRGKKSVRIDYIFHSEAITGVNYYKTPLTYSDHYPVFMTLEVK